MMEKKHKLFSIGPYNIKPLPYVDVIGSLCARDYKGVGSQYVREGKLILCRMLAFGSYQKSDISSTLKQRDYKDATDLVVIGGVDGNTETKVRRITPLECERLQGYPDGWTDIGDWTDSSGKKHKAADSPRYKALGNSIAIPPWEWVLERLSSVCGEDKTMASLFDGIGGFPLIWERINGPGTCVWGSEIDEFANAVTRHRFPEKEGSDQG